MDGATARRDEHLGRAAPDHHQPLAAVPGLKRPDVLAELLGELPLGAARLHVRPLEPLDVLAVERRRHRGDPAQEVAHRVEVLVAVEHAGLDRGGVGVVGYRVPGAEHEVVERGEGNEVADQWGPVLGALAEPDRPHLRERADRVSAPAPDVLDPGDERRRDRPEADAEDPEPPFRRRDLGRRRRSRPPAPRSALGHR
jgi:hypothetical protein